MAKKKSKTQKYKKNIKKKAKKIQNIELKDSNTLELKNKSIDPKPELPKLKEKKELITKVTKENKQKNKNNPIQNTKDKKITMSIEKNKKSAKKHYKKTNIDKKQSKPNQNTIFSRLLYELKINNHIIFNTIIIIIFIIMFIGLIRINVLQTGTIIYICVIALFLISIAISYNKYISGKVFTIILCIVMSFAIYKMQYTYDFIRNLNSNIYEYKTYYVVTFDTSQNKSIYNITNKKVGLLKDNCINIERKLNTKLDNVNYIEYDDINELFNDFYTQQFRAILVNENQYKYLQNHIENDRDVKILYEFSANAKK